MAKSCFVIAPIGDADSDTRRRSDQVLKHVIRPAAKECGYSATRADEISEPGIITSQVIQHIVDDDLVIADLTDRNPNVFYELALRHALKKPLVQIIKKGEQIPFDVAGMRTIPVDHHDLDNVDEAREEIIKQIRSLESAPTQIDTPISVALDLQSLRQSEDPEERSLADLVSAIAEIRGSLASVEKRLSDPEALLPAPYLRHVMRRVGTPLLSEPRAFLEIDRLVSRISDLSAVNKKGPDSEELRESLHVLRSLLHSLVEREEARHYVQQ